VSSLFAGLVLVVEGRRVQKPAVDLGFEGRRVLGVGEPLDEANGGLVSRNVRLRLVLGQLCRNPRLVHGAYEAGDPGRKDDHAGLGLSHNGSEVLAAAEGHGTSRYKAYTLTRIQNKLTSAKCIRLNHIASLYRYSILYRQHQSICAN